MSNPATGSPWHDGERRLQSLLGVDGRMAEVGPRVIRDYMPDQHRALFAQLPFVVLGSVDPQGRAWATLLAGAPGFMSSPDPRTLDVRRSRDPSDPASAGVHDGAALGLLGIDLHSRRRNRMNGAVVATDAGAFRVQVEHSFGNCPRYIQSRLPRAFRDPAAPFSGEVEALGALDARAGEQIAAADTFFVASYVDRAAAGGRRGPDSGHRQVDVSHRGGQRGFVRVAEDGTLTIPDFAGNLHFNTLGNLLLNPRAGLLFVDFTSGDLLQLCGDAEVILDSPEIAAFQGAERLWTFRPRAVVRRRDALPLRFRFGDDSPNSLLTGGGPTGKRVVKPVGKQQTGVRGREQPDCE